MDAGKTFDVVVLGGGVAGVSAAMAAAKEGADTVLIERLGWLGGMVTGAYVVALCGMWDGHLGTHQVVRGNFTRITDRAVQEKVAEWTKWNRHCKKGRGREVTVDPEGFKWLLDTMLMESGATLMLHSPIVAAYLDPDQVIRGVQIIGEEQNRFVYGKVFIDCTGDGESAEWVGLTSVPPISADEVVSMGLRIGGVDAARAVTDKDHPAPMVSCGRHTFSADGWLSLVNGRGELFFDCLALRDCYHLTVEDLTRAEVHGRHFAHHAISQLRKYPGFKNAYLISTGPTLGARKPRAVLTRYYLSDEDENQHHEDSIAVAGNVCKDHGAMEIPYRCLLPKKVSNLLLAGRTFTPQHSGPGRASGRNFTGYEIPRLVAPCVATGEAAGVAAALAAKAGITCDKVDVKLLQERLAARGAVYKQP